jgi:glycosyltransferase involved in cell wall biosynthesis
MTPDLCVAVCTFRRRVLLPGVLTSLQAQKAPGIAWEVLIVDNAVDAGVAALVAEWQSRPLPFHLRYVPEPRVGLSFARNRAIVTTLAPLIAFIDDDAQAGTNWVPAMLAAFARWPRCDALGGPIRPVASQALPGWWPPEYASLLTILDLEAEDGWLKGPHFPAGANCAFRRAVLESVGGFRTDLGPGAEIPFGDDSEMFRRLLCEGHHVRFEPEIWVYHDLPSERLTYSYFSQRLHSEGRVQAALDRQFRGWLYRLLRGFARLGFWLAGVPAWLGTRFGTKPMIERRCAARWHKLRGYWYQILRDIVHLGRIG